MINTCYYGDGGNAIRLKMGKPLLMDHLYSNGRQKLKEACS